MNIEKLKNEIIKAMRSQDTLRLKVLRTLLSDTQNIAINDRRKDITNEDLINAVTTQIKKHNDSIEQFTKGNRQDLVDVEKTELKIYKEFQPKQMSEDEIISLVDKVISETGATSKKEMGHVMSSLNKQMQKGTFNMKKLSGLVMLKLQ